MINLVVFIISVLASLFIGPFIFDMLISNGSTGLNYRGEKIPVGMGLLFILIQVFLIFSASLFELGVDKTILLAYIISIILIGLIGFTDDLIGETDIKGFKGHIKALLRGKLTTGGLKAVVGLVIAVLFSLNVYNGIFELGVNILLITLFTNIINLFDLRPGRAIKVFSFLSIALIITSYINEYNFIIYAALGIIIVYSRYDLKAKSMMGDIGSNALGMTLGTFCVLTHSLTEKIVYLIILIILHGISEFSSFSKIIKNNSILNYLDNIGR